MYVCRHVYTYIYLKCPCVSTWIPLQPLRRKLGQVAIRLLRGEVALAGWEGERPGGLKSHPGAVGWVLGLWDAGNEMGISAYKYASIWWVYDRYIVRIWWVCNKYTRSIHVWKCVYIYIIYMYTIWYNGNRTSQKHDFWMSEHGRWSLWKSSPLPILWGRSGEAI